MIHYIILADNTCQQLGAPLDLYDDSPYFTLEEAIKRLQQDIKELEARIQCSQQK